MAAIWETLTDPGKLYPIAWGVTLACVLIAYLASKALKNHPRMFMAMALLACAWVLVLGAYGAREARPLSYLVTDIASFLLVYVGVMLTLEGPQGQRLAIASWLQRGGFWLLLAIVLPRQLNFPSAMQLQPLSVDQFEMAAGLALTLLSFLSVGLGVWAISAGWAFYALVADLVFYAYLNIERTVDIWGDGANARPMSAFFIYGFALAKVVLTGLFAYVVVRHANPDTSQPTRSAAPGALRTST
jgi:hypothetical protein